MDLGITKKSVNQWIRSGGGSLPPDTTTSPLVKCCCCLFGELRRAKNYSTPKLFRFMSSCACPFWGVKHFRPQTPWLTVAKPHPLSLFISPRTLSFSLDPSSSPSKTLTSLHISSTASCQRKITADAMQGSEERQWEEVGGRASCPAPAPLLLLFRPRFLF